MSALKRRFLVALVGATVLLFVAAPNQAQNPGKRTCEEQCVQNNKSLFQQCDGNLRSCENDFAGDSRSCNNQKDSLQTRLDRCIEQKGPDHDSCIAAKNDLMAIQGCFTAASATHDACLDLVEQCVVDANATLQSCIDDC